MLPLRFLGLLVILASPGLLCASIEPVTPNASPEARALLQLLQDISGRHLLTGQHNFPNIKDRNTQFAAKYTGHLPAVFSTDWGFERDGNTDSYLARPDIVQEAIRQHRLGSLVTICWHAVPPTADEPVTFQPRPGSDPKALASVQGKLLDEQFRDLLTPGTPLYEKWCKQVDAVAVFLKQLQAAHVPVLWRPYHEMNGDWFWWGGRGADTAALYRQIFDRLVRHHGINNLVWIWSVDRANKPGMEHEKYFPGIDYVDVLGLDVYRNDFAQSNYDSLVKLAQGKPLALAEVGNPPSLEVLQQQPKWTFYVVWAGMARNATKKTYENLHADPRVLSLDQPAYAAVTATYRQACGLPPVIAAPPAVNYSGHWVINEEESNFGRMGASFAPAGMEIAHEGNAFKVRSTRVVEFADDQVTEQTYLLDGTETQSIFMDAPRTTAARLSGADGSIEMDSLIAFPWGPTGTKVRVKETWRLLGGGRKLAIDQTSDSPMGQQQTRQVFDRR